MYIFAQNIVFKLFVLLFRYILNGTAYFHTNLQMFSDSLVLVIDIKQYFKNQTGVSFIEFYHLHVHVVKNKRKKKMRSTHKIELVVIQAS